MNLLLAAFNCSDGTLSKTAQASFALIRHNIIGNEPSAHSRWTLLFKDMGLIFPAEITNGTEDRVRCSLSQTTDRASFNALTQLNKQVDVLYPALPFRYSVKDL